jgi:hypothetical protein
VHDAFNVSVHYVEQRSLRFIVQVVTGRDFGRSETFGHFVERFSPKYTTIGAGPKLPLPAGDSIHCGPELLTK